MSTLQTQAVFCIARDHVKALSILNHLHRSGFSDSDISTVLAPMRQRGEVMTGVRRGLVVDDVLGEITASLAIPGAAPFLGAGPIMVERDVSQIRSPHDGLTDGLMGLGLSEYAAMQYVTYLAGGNALISVSVINDEELDVVCSIFEEDGADRIEVQTLNPDHSRERSFAVGAAQTV